MKKVLLSVVALVAAMGVNAQEFAPFTNEAADKIGLGEEKIAVPGGTVLLETASVVCTLAYEQAECGRTGLSKNDVTINGTEFGSETGIQGSTNGPGSAASAGEYPESGACMYHFDVKKDGYLYVFHKSSANKNYVVFEEKLRIPYIYSAADGGYYDLNTIEGATVTADGITNIAADYAIGQAQVIIGEDGKGAGTCVLKFPVFAGCGYDALATGSKMTFAGFYFDETGDANISAGDVVLLNGNPNAVQGVKVDVENGTVYNLAGQKVDASYKGVVIQNGKKVIK